MKKLRTTASLTQSTDCLILCSPFFLLLCCSRVDSCNEYKFRKTVTLKVRIYSFFFFFLLNPIERTRDAEFWRYRF